MGNKYIKKQTSEENEIIEEKEKYERRVLLYYLIRSMRKMT
jgi:hypothetical protein